ncbi:MAG: DNA-binding protein [Paucibacter sp.]|nr:DNA-binding protein [Roseateles sp.]
MDNKEVSSNDVEAAAERLKRDGFPVTAEALASALGAASAASIQKHLLAWRMAEEKSIQKPRVDIHGSVVETIEAWAQNLVDEARSEYSSRLSRIEADLAPILDSSEKAEAENQALARQLAEATAALERVQLILAQRDASIESLTVELRHARDIASDAVVGKAKDQLAIEGKDAQIAELRLQVERNVAAISAASDARLAAEMELVGAVTARDAFAAEIQTLRAQLDERRAELRR